MEQTEQFLLQEKTRILKKYQCKTTDEALARLKTLLSAESSKQKKQILQN